MFLLLTYLLSNKIKEDTILHVIDKAGTTWGPHQ